MKLLTKREQKKKENSVHHYVKNHLAKFQQDKIKPERVGALRLSNGYNFFLKNVSEVFRTCFNLPRNLC